MKRTILIFVVISAAVVFGNAQPSDETYNVFDAKGKSVDLRVIVDAMSGADVVFLGESHDDSVAHALQLEIFKRADEKFGGSRKISLSLEMFQRDVQIILDEYLKDLITEKHFLENSRPWGNYATDYRPLVEFAKENDLQVIAANAPRRYVNMVSRNGRNAITKLSPEAKSWLPPLPFGLPSKTYAAKFNARMGGHGSKNILESQALWDASMSYSIAQNLTKNKLIIHLNGSFHTANRLGTVEHLLKYKPETRVLVVTMTREKEFRKFDGSKHTDLGDFVILTDEKQPKSKR